MRRKALSVVWEALLRDSSERAVAKGALAVGVCMAAMGVMRRERSTQASEMWGHAGR